jgi:serine/threonine protein kinase
MPALGLKSLLIVSLVWLVVIAHAEYALPRTARSLSDLYVVEKELGSGAFGRVYEGKAKSDPSRPVAIKQIRAKDSTTWVEMNFMMANEAGDFPGIPRLYDIVQTKNSVYIIMQLFIGDDPGRLVWKQRYIFPKKTL